MQITKTVGASERIFELLGEESETEIHAQHEHKPKLQGEITFENVQFAYPTRPDAIILNNMNLHIRPGEKIALAGHSGAGKSTVAQLILQFYHPQSGEILMDGKPSLVYPVQELRANMAVVPQEVLLFGGSIRENIAYGKITASEEEIIEAAKKAHAWEFIARFPEGLETVVGERGIKLSGGQRQRIAIARAILKDPAILILDEATSSLDAESEKLVQDALEKLMLGRTTIIIAHRLSTIRNVDRILVIQDGAVAEEGSYVELSAKTGGIFHNLLQLQYRDVVESNV
ncbi:MAG: ABC subfamily B transporter ATP-binding protein [Chitinophagales bacterium]